MDFEALDWKILDRLRGGFIGSPGAHGPYWQTTADLAQYDQSFGERIGWKWDAILAELSRRGWSPAPGLWIDWGCGSGIAGRRVARTWPAQAEEVAMLDHSSLAMDFAVQRGIKAGLRARQALASDVASTLVISHVLNELPDPARSVLERAIRSATCVIWVEPGTHAASRDLAGWRDRLADEFRVVAPCTHTSPCPLFALGNENHWCHFFADPPSGIHADSDWVRFGQRAGVDLRSLPYSWLVLDRRPRAPSEAPLPANSARRIGHIESDKTGVRWLQCESAGRLADVAISQRADKALCKRLDRKPGLPLVASDDSGSSWSEVFPRDA